MTPPTIVLLLRVFRVYRAVTYQLKEEYNLPSRCLATIGLHIQAHRLMGRINEERRSDGLSCHDMRNKFHKHWFRHTKVNTEGVVFTDTQTAMR
jgi:hypothetical protein